MRQLNPSELQAVSGGNPLLVVVYTAIVTSVTAVLAVAADREGMFDGIIGKR